MVPFIDAYYDLTLDDFLTDEEIAEINERKVPSPEEYAAFMDFRIGEVSLDD